VIFDLVVVVDEYPKCCCCFIFVLNVVWLRSCLMDMSMVDVQKKFFSIGTSKSTNVQSG